MTAESITGVRSALRLVVAERTLVTSRIPVPDTGGAVPDTGGAFPDTGEAVPDTGGAVPDTGGAVPDTVEPSRTRWSRPGHGGAVPDAVEPSRTRWSRPGHRLADLRGEGHERQLPRARVHLQTFGEAAEGPPVPSR
jgi:hypothetical protein